MIQHVILVFLLGLALVVSALGQTVVFENVNVIPVDRERVLGRQAVIVRDGRIAQIGPARKLKVPDGALRVDGSGRYLVPGLRGMHRHLPPPQTPRGEWEDLPVLYHT